MVGMVDGLTERKEQDMEEKIPINIFNWGPCVVQCKIKEEFRQLLLKEAKLNSTDFRDKLAGQIDHETGYSEESKARILPTLSQYLVIYLDIPEALKEENQNYIGKSCGPGGIQFLYGDGPRDCVTYMSHFPETRDMFIFPAWLKHWVSPYQSDCTRISVSGNVHDSAPLNNILKFGPEYIKGRKK
jgi:hypothetical protein